MKKLGNKRGAGGTFGKTKLCRVEGGRGGFATLVEGRNRYKFSNVQRFFSRILVREVMTEQV